MTSLLGAGQGVADALAPTTSGRGWPGSRPPRRARAAGSTTPWSTTRPAVVDRAAARLRLSADHTVVAIAGATGSGKSSTFNALVGLDLAAVGVRRPTTSWASACVWGRDGADDVLDWLGIPERHRVVRDSMLDTGRREDRTARGRGPARPARPRLDRGVPPPRGRPAGAARRPAGLGPRPAEVRRRRDPRPLPRAAGRPPRGDAWSCSTTSTPCPRTRRDSMLADVRRLLDQRRARPACRSSPSAPGTATGIGRAEARDRRPGGGQAGRPGSGWTPTSGRPPPASTRRPGGPGWTRRRGAGSRRWRTPSRTRPGCRPWSPRSTESTRVRANRATGWPVTSWLSRLRPDPLKRLHLDLGAAGKHLTGRAADLGARSRPRCSAPGSTPRCGRCPTRSRPALAPPWARAVRRASTSRLDDLGDRLDAALGATDLGVARLPIWAGAGAAAPVAADPDRARWRGVARGAGGDGLPAGARSRTPRTWRGVPWPTLMLLGGVALGILLALVCRLLVRLTARSRGRTARPEAHRRDLGGRAASSWSTPIEAELAAYREVRAGLDRALK